MYEDQINNSRKGDAGNGELTLDEYTGFLREIGKQPEWRTKADREADYCDGNQLDAEILSRMEEIGIPPAIEPLMGPVIASVLGMEIRNRGDWKVSADSQGGEQVAEALNHKLHTAEVQSKADSACSDAFASQAKVGLGCVYVGRQDDPFLYPYKVETVRRNEVFWDWWAKTDLSDARWFIRRKWVDRRIPELLFPDSADLIRHSGTAWADFSFDTAFSSRDALGELSPTLYAAADQERSFTVESSQWRDLQNNRVVLSECWYRRWEWSAVLRSPDGRVVEFDRKNPAHVMAVSAGMLVPEKAIVSRVRLSWWMGPHKLADNPHKSKKFPYVLFWGYREDRTFAPYGLARAMIYLQDQVNALHSKSQWLLSARRVVRTEGAVVGTDEQFRQEAARPDADIKLSVKAMRDGGIFRVENDLQLTEQQFNRLQDSREAMRRVVGVYSEFSGDNRNTTSGVQFNSQVEQSNQSLSDLLDNFKTARSEVGDLLVELIIEDTIGKEETVVIDGLGINPDKSIYLNSPAIHESGVPFLNNDVERVRLKVGIDQIPSAVTYRQQQLAALSEAFKVCPPEYQHILLPHMLALMDLPGQSSLLRQLKDAYSLSSPDQVQQQIEDAVAQAMKNAKHDLEMLKIEQNNRLIAAQIRKLNAESVNTGVEGMFSATQAARNIASDPHLSPLADSMLLSVGFQDQDHPPIIPGVPAGTVSPPPARNTDPITPTNPDVGMDTGVRGGDAPYTGGPQP